MCSPSAPDANGQSASWAEPRRADGADRLRVTAVGLMPGEAGHQGRLQPFLVAADDVDGVAPAEQLPGGGPGTSHLARGSPTS
ncbi:MAG TPA: hypothetical protein VGD29_11040 [Actinoplanes sp.]|jgi:hypothetical protein